MTDLEFERRFLENLLAAVSALRRMSIGPHSGEIFLRTAHGHATRGLEAVERGDLIYAKTARREAAHLLGAAQERQIAADAVRVREARLNEADARQRAEKVRQREARQIAGQSKGNATRKARASEWKARAQYIAEGHPDTDWFNVSKVAEDVIKAWPENSRKPGNRALRGFLSELAKRHVPPDL